MAAIRTSGGTDNFHFTWNGAKVQASIDEGIDEAMGRLKEEVATSLKTELHKWPLHSVHRLAGESFAEVSVSSGRRTLIAGSRAPYAVFEELRHPVMRSIMDKYIPKVTQYIQAAIARRAR